MILIELMMNLKWATTKGTIIELMAGMGRNYTVYQSLFKKFEMLDGSRNLLRLVKVQDVVLHKQSLQEMRWPSQKYECILGYICLGYLDKLEVNT